MDLTRTVSGPCATRWTTCRRCSPHPAREASPAAYVRAAARRIVADGDHDGVRVLLGHDGLPVHSLAVSQPCADARARSRDEGPLSWWSEDPDHPGRGRATVELPARAHRRSPHEVMRLMSWKSEPMIQEVPDPTPGCGPGRHSGGRCGRLPLRLAPHARLRRGRAALGAALHPRSRGRRAGPLRRPGGAVGLSPVNRSPSSARGDVAPVAAASMGWRRTATGRTSLRSPEAGAVWGWTVAWPTTCSSPPPAISWRCPTGSTPPRRHPDRRRPHSLPRRPALPGQAGRDVDGGRHRRGRPRAPCGTGAASHLSRTHRRRRSPGVGP